MIKGHLGHFPQMPFFDFVLAQNQNILYPIGMIDYGDKGVKGSLVPALVESVYEL